ncbi:MAG: type II toxin-antitoxin system prevent-host-death family antitoxin [Steroidobacteraceae bacterium]
MKTVGVRDLKNKLSEYLRRVRLGESVLVTDRGEVVAELQPPGQRQGDPSVPAGLQSLVKRGLLTLGAPAGTDLYPVLARKLDGRRQSVAQLLDDERGTR